MKNEICTMTIEEYKKLSPVIKLNNCFVVNIDGEKVNNKITLFETLMTEFSLPDINGWDSASDWMTDLGWIKAKNFQLNIHNFSSFLENDMESKRIFMEMLSEDVLPFWEKEVLTTVVEGETKGFDVYCLD
ncbi:barstar family protein [Enterococcus sp. 5H]|uniref:barstar family protein n=1 Tax=Enterococcus sp. 5H TaxID=1229490 RepID=UPI002304A155|nr:barstar family protein [Enterococcus sp. 5H]MDA9471880.1 hypothetical protein [Enterococcus sp. 5H]